MSENAGLGRKMPFMEDTTYPNSARSEAKVSPWDA